MSIRIAISPTTSELPSLCCIERVAVTSTLQHESPAMYAPFAAGWSGRARRIIHAAVANERRQQSRMQQLWMKRSARSSPHLAVSSASLVWMFPRVLSTADSSKWVCLAVSRGTRRNLQLLRSVSDCPLRKAINIGRRTIGCRWNLPMRSSSWARAFGVRCSFAGRKGKR